MDDKLKPIASLIADKITHHCFMLGAHHNRNWWSTKNNKDMISEFDRIKSVEYHTCRHDIGPRHRRDSHPPLKDPEFYDHTMHLFWKEPFGMGTPGDELSDILKDGCYKQGPNGNWYMPMDYAFYVSLWHPDKQAFQEAHYFWGKKERYHWRPVYHYVVEEVDATLKEMAKMFDWEYKGWSGEGRGSYIF